MIFAWLRNGFYVGLSVALLLGIFLMRLWQPERQVRLHTEHFFQTVEQKTWTDVTEFIAPDFTDQWGDDRARVIARAREVFRYTRGIRINAPDALIRTEHRRASWTGKITITGDEGEITGAIKERVNSLTTPFELEWRRGSAKPWDWKLFRVSNPTLEIPADFD